LFFLIHMSLRPLSSSTSHSYRSGTQNNYSRDHDRDQYPSNEQDSWGGYSREGYSPERGYREDNSRQRYYSNPNNRNRNWNWNRNQNNEDEEELNNDSFFIRSSTQHKESNYNNSHYNNYNYNNNDNDNNVESATNPWLIRKQHYEDRKQKIQNEPPKPKPQPPPTKPSTNEEEELKQKKKKKKKPPKEKTLEQIRLEEKIARRPKPTEVTLSDFVTKFFVQNNTRKSKKQTSGKGSNSKKNTKQTNANTSKIAKIQSLTSAQQKLEKEEQRFNVKKVLSKHPVIVRQERRKEKRFERYEKRKKHRLQMQKKIGQ